MTEAAGPEAAEDDRAAGRVLPHTISEWQRLLADLEVRPSTGLGQHFLFERGVVDRIARAAEIERSDRVLEIGPGLGILTEALLARAGQVTAIEYDRRLADHLLRTFGRDPRFRLIVGDALQVSIDEIYAPDEPFSVVANLPYSVGSAVLKRLLDHPHRPRRLVVMVQREVAERLAAAPGDLTVLGVAAQFYATVAILFDVAPSVFMPPPTVVSAVVRLDVHPSLPLTEHEIPEFFRIVRAGFNQKRKHVANSIAARFALDKATVGAWFGAAGIDPERRAQTLTIGDWVNLRRHAPELPEGDTSQTRRRDRRPRGGVA